MFTQLIIVCYFSLTTLSTVGYGDLFPIPEAIVPNTGRIKGLDGNKKMSKSLDNYIGIDEDPDSMFGKIMSISDELMWRYLELLSFESLETIASWKKEVENGENPRNIKFRLAEEIIARFHNNKAAKKAQQNFIDRFAKNQTPDEMDEFL